MRKKKEKTPLPNGLEIDALVLYYDQGWRAGYLREVKGRQLGVEPVAAYKKSAHNLTWHEVSDVKLAEGKDVKEHREVPKEVRKRNRRV